MESEGWERWIPVARRLLDQAYYRILSFISFHAPLEEAYLALEAIQSELGGNLYWVRPDKLAKWENLEIYPNIYMSLWIFGGPRNTVYARIGWWRLYILESMIRRASGVTQQG